MRIVPATRLLFVFSAIALPLLGLAGLFPEGSALTGFGLLVFFVMILIDAFRSVDSVKGISIELPKLVRLSNGVPGEIPVFFQNASSRKKSIRTGLPLPWAIFSETLEMKIQIPGDNQRSRFAWPCQPMKRGQWFMKQAFLEGTSPWGFWLFRLSIPIDCELRVYPSLREDRKRVSALFLNRGSFGVHAVRQVGKGREFESLREYLPGDGYDEIHWKATARRARPVTKVFQIERTQEVYVVVDASRLAARQVEFPSTSNPVQGSTGKASTVTAPRTRTILERYVNAALMIGMAAERQGDLFGMLVFSDRVEKFQRAKNGKEHYAACREALYNLEAKIVSPDFNEVAAFIRLRLRRRALLIFLTALEDPLVSEQFVQNIELICRQHLIVATMLRPAMARPLFAETEVENLDHLYSTLGGHLLWQRLEELNKLLKRRGVRFLQLNHENLSAELVSEYLQVKKRQLL